MVDESKKVALITGSGRGIGRGIAIQLAQAGWTIVINDINNPEPPEETLRMVQDAGSDGMILLANITLAEERKRMVEAILKAYGRPRGRTQAHGGSNPQSLWANRPAGQ